MSLELTRLVTCCALSPTERSRPMSHLSSICDRFAPRMNRTSCRAAHSVCQVLIKASAGHHASPCISTFLGLSDCRMLAQALIREAWQTAE